MDVDDDDAFLYGEQSPPPASAPLVPPNPGASAASEPDETKVDIPAMTSSMAAYVSHISHASLAAYGIKPTEAVAAPDNPEDGGVEEEEDDMEEDEDSDDEEDVKLVFSTASRGLDLRKPQAQPSNVIGIGKWAHTSTGKEVAPSASPAPTPTKAPTPAPIPGQTTEYTPAARPGTSQTPTSSTTLVNPPIPPSGDAGTAPNLAVPQTQPNGVNGYLPPSDLPLVTAPSSYPKIDPSNPTGVIPSTGTSVYEIDLAQFEGSGQPWRRPGSDISDWFNFGFDETTFPKFLRFRQEMEAGRQALMNLPMGVMPPQVAELLHLQMNPMNGNMGMGMGAPGGTMPFNPQMIQNMIMQGIDPAMMLQQMQQMGMGGQGMMPQGMMQEQIQQRQPSAAVPRPNASTALAPSTPMGALEPGEEVKIEEGSELIPSESGIADGQGTAGGRGQGLAPGVRGGVSARGATRGRGAVPLGPRAGVALPANIPKGPKAGRFRDKDKVDNATSSLDYGADHTPSEGGSRDRSLSRSPSKSRRRREKSYDSYASDDSSEREYQRRKAAKKREREKEDEEEKARRREKRKRDDGSSGSAVLGPGGWESGEEEEASRTRSSRRRRSPSTADEEKYKSSRRKR
ncbi:hypothetical protein BCR39DRAFT_556550 [Naematelia encephala]|uniref:Pre-mRNA polyadenylation factor Fip1 domain-containing protein n=1 Tax=Naematelia encephala TaxID=71784 RepID=A0A1Y2BKA3_9TREE|nr:hypothetical protein BCR39DRAFT_556550 [Naematelia encephala]